MITELKTDMNDVAIFLIKLAPIVQKVDSAIQPFEQLGPEVHFSDDCDPLDRWKVVSF